MLDVPVVFCIYNRPALTEKVFAAIRRERPQTLLVIADGPNKNRVGDVERVLETRRILTQIDWPCQVLTNLSETNLGCRLRMATGLTWAFEQVEQAIILEDDCLPNRSFFRFCSAMLDRYQHDERVMMVSGDRFYPESPVGPEWYFSRWAHIWGWASWRRAWKRYDLGISSWPEVRERPPFLPLLTGAEEWEGWKHVFDQVHAESLDTWDFSWMYTLWFHQGVSIIPPRNLVSNLGFGLDATHTTDSASPLSRLEAHELETWQAPSHFERNRIADDWTYHQLFAASLIPPPQKKPKTRWWAPWRRVA